MQDCGAIYHKNGEAKDPFELFAEHGANLVRARLWNDPDWTNYSTLEDVKKTFTRAKEQWMRTMLDFHYSDNWADPGRQEVPAAWAVIEDVDELAKALYQYTYDVLIELDGQGLMPDFVQVGNEINSGLVKENVGLDWPRDAQLIQAGIRAVRDAAAATDTSPRIILHVAQPENTSAWFRGAAENGITDFDVIGISYYPQWSSYSISGLGSQVNSLRRTYGKDVMVVETGYPWTLEAADETASNVLTQGLSGYPISPAGQLRFLTDLTQTLISNGGTGIVYWEPAWVSTGCSTRWGQGSHWENATFFDFKNDNELLLGIDYMTSSYLFPNRYLDGLVEKEYGAPIAEDVPGDAQNEILGLDLLALNQFQENASISFAITLAGDFLETPGLRYRMYFDTTENEAGGTVDIGKRPIEVADPYQPEFILEIQVVGERGTTQIQGTWYRWADNAWVESAFTGGMAAAGSVIELQFPLRVISNPDILNVAVISANRVLTGTASDVTGSDSVPADSADVVRVEAFTHVDLTAYDTGK
jgi:arabinogalactan endo-1,4-beta-galactosidase